MSSASPLADVVTSPDALGYLNLLVFGQPGAGKTRLVGTAQDHPMTSPLLLLDVEGGTTTLRNRKDIDVIQVRSPKDVIEAHNSLLLENNGYYKTVAIDSLSELQDVDMAEVMRKMLQARPDRDPDIPDMREWGQSRAHIRKIVRAFRDLPLNTIFTALVLVEKNPQTGVTTLYPNLPGKLRIEVPGFLDVVGYLHANVDGGGNIVRTIQFAQTRGVIAKDRTDALGDKIDDPTIPGMWDLLHNDNDKKEAKKK